MNSARALCVATALVLATGVSVGAQSPAAPGFEVASVKPSPPADPSNPLSMVPIMMPQPGGRFRGANVPLWVLIATAWELPDTRIVGGNKGLLNTRYDITAKAEGTATLGQKELLPALKGLLVDRFQLKAHVEPREMALYDLVLARSDGRLGPALKPSMSDCSNTEALTAKRVEAVARGDFTSVMSKPGEFLSCSISPNLAGGPANLALHGDGQDMKVLAGLLSQFSGRYVRDKTGLTGRYDFDLKLDPQVLLGFVQKMGMNGLTGALESLPQSDGSSLMTAINEQLGLKLESSRGPVDILVIDSVEAPTPD